MGTQNSQPMEGRQLQSNGEKIQQLARVMKIKKDQQKDLTDSGVDRHEQNMHSMQMLKGIYKKLDPTVLTMMEEVMGEIQLSLKYNAQHEQLLVKVIRCRDLRNKDMRSKMTDPYVKLQLFPDSENQGVKETKISPRTNSPTYQEIFSFSLGEIDLLDARLVVQVWDADLMSQDDFLGETIIKMNTFNFRRDPVHTAWYMLNMETDLGISGELDVTLAFQLPQSLFVTVHRATNLAARADDGHTDPFVKLSIPGTNTVFKTQVQKDTVHPIWEETFEFLIPQEEFQNRYIVFHIVDHNVSSGNDSLGQVILDLVTFDPEEGLHGSYELADLRSSERLRNIWSQRVMAQEFKESLQAHAFAGQPHMLFKKHSGKKIVTVTCRRAGTRGRIRIIDGIPVY